MSWLPQDKLTTKEKEKLKVIQQRKDSLIGKYHTQIKSQTTTHETKDKTTKQYNKDLEEIELEIDELAKEINKQIG